MTWSFPHTYHLTWSFRMQRFHIHSTFDLFIIILARFSYTFWVCFLTRSNLRYEQINTDCMIVGKKAKTTQRVLCNMGFTARNSGLFLDHSKLETCFSSRPAFKKCGALKCLFFFCWYLKALKERNQRPEKNNNEKQNFSTFLAKNWPRNKKSACLIGFFKK